MPELELLERSCLGYISAVFK